MIAEAWDIESYLLGRAFPGINWRQWNGKYRDDLRDFVRGVSGRVGALMQRLYGSDDLFPDDLENSYRPFQSVNFITAHDGFMSLRSGRRTTTSTTRPTGTAIPTAPTITAAGTAAGKATMARPTRCSRCGAGRCGISCAC